MPTPIIINIYNDNMRRYDKGCDNIPFRWKIYNGIDNYGNTLKYYDKDNDEYYEPYIHPFLLCPSRLTLHQIIERNNW